MRDFNSLSMSLCQACQKSNSALPAKEGDGQKKKMGLLKLHFGKIKVYLATKINHKSLKYEIPL